MHTLRMLIAAGIVLFAGSRDAAGWGCDGHRAVVYLAERLMPPQTVTAAREMLKASPVDPALRRYCDPIPDDPLVDDALWADDYRSTDPTTFGWHFINVPRTFTLTASNEPTFCAGGNCVVSALAAQYRLLTTSIDPMIQGNALRFVVHFVGDVAQPLHVTTNGDRGGNCVALTYYDRAPQQSETTPNDFSPNLHGVWDSSTIRTVMSQHGLADARALADYIASRHPLPAIVAKQPLSKAVAVRWARDSHRAGASVVYKRLPVEVGIEPASAVALASCAGNHDVVHRMLAKHIVIDGRYERAAVPVIVEQLRAAGVRLAATLKAAIP